MLVPRASATGTDPIGASTQDPVAPRRAPAVRRDVEGPRLAFGRGWRRGLLVAHVVSSGAWIGIDVIVAVLVSTGWFADDLRLRSLAYQALAAFVVWPMLVSGLVCLGTGLFLGLGTKWGLFRYWWVVVKLVLNLLLCTLIVVVLQPGMDEVAVYGQQLRTGTPESTAAARLFFPPAVSLSCLALAAVLAVFKPWGTMRRPGGRGSGLAMTTETAPDGRERRRPAGATVSSRPRTVTTDDGLGPEEEPQ